MKILPPPITTTPTKTGSPFPNFKSNPSRTLKQSDLVYHHINELNILENYTLLRIWSTIVKANTKSFNDLLRVSIHVSFKLVLCFEISFANITGCVFFSVFFKNYSILKLHAALFTSSVDFQNVVFKISFGF